MSTLYDEALSLLRVRAASEAESGHERITALLDALADPHRGYPTIHVTGSSGKTSTTRMIGSLVAAHGLTTGIFTSPHLEAVEDCFGYAERPMTRAEFVDTLGEVESVAQLVETSLGGSVSEFEVLTAMACTWFADVSVGVGVIQAGPGRRYDPTNVVRSEVAVITGVDLDRHQGPTLDEIAEDSFGILDHGAALVTGPLDPEVEAVARRFVDAHAAPWYRFGTDMRPDDVHRSIAGWLFDVEGIHERYSQIALRLRGRHQVRNFTVAIAAAEALVGRPLDEAAVREVAATITAPGAMESVWVEPLVLLDAAPNPAGIETLADVLAEEFPTTRWVVVMGAMDDEVIEGMLAALGPIATDRVIATSSSLSRALSAGNVASRAREILSVPVEAIDHVPDAMEVAMALGIPVLVTGSMSVVGEARRTLRKSTT